MKGNQVGQRGGTIQSSMIATGSQNIVSKPSAKTQLLNNFLDSAKGMMGDSQRNEGQLNMSSKRA